MPLIRTRCIGCGLCVGVCPQQAISMQPRDVLPDVPENALAMNIAHAQRIGKRPAPGLRAL